MAKIETKITTEAQVQTVLVEKKIYVLELDENEILALNFVLSRVGGCPNNSPRGYIDSLYDELCDLDLGIPKSFQEDPRKAHLNTIYFADFEQGE